MTDYSFNTLEVTLDGGVLELVLSRPESRNAINREMQMEFEMALDRAELDPDVGAVLFRGEGHLFSAGADLKQRIGDERTFPIASPSTGPALPRAWYFRKPLIGAVHRYVGPGAISLVCCCDFNIAAEGTRFSFEVFRGGSGRPGMVWAPLYLQLPMRVVEKLFLLGGWLDAEEALHFQFVQRVVPEDQLVSEGRRWAEQAALMPSESFGHAKDQIRRSYELLGLSSMPAALARFGPPPSEEGADFRRMIQAHGLHEAVRMRDEKFDQDVARV